MTDRKERPDEDTAYIDESDRSAILKRMQDRGVSKAALAVACGVTRSAITLLLSKQIPKGETRGCRFASKLEAALGYAIPKKKPSLVPSDLQQRANLILREFGDDLDELRHWLDTGERLAKKSKELLLAKRLKNSQGSPSNRR